MVSVTVKVTWSLPPQALGARPSLVNSSAHPPLTLPVANHAANSESTVACDCPLATVVSVGQFRTTGGAFNTVKVPAQATGPSQSLRTESITVTEPPHPDGARGTAGVRINTG